MNERLRHYLAPGVAVILGLTACSAQESLPSPPSSSVAAATEQPQKPPCIMAQGLDVKNGEAVWVQAGVTEITRAPELGKLVIGRMVYGRDGTTVGRLVSAQGDLHAWKITDIKQTVGAQRYTRGGVDRANDACVPHPDSATPPALDAQLVTITGSQTVDGERFPSFNDGDRKSTSALGAYNDGGVGITFSKVPDGFRQTN